MNPISTHLATTPNHPTYPRTPGKSPHRPSDAEKSVGMRPPKKPKPRSAQTGLPLQGRPELPPIHEMQVVQQLPVGRDWDHVFVVYVDAVAKSDLGSFPDHVKNTPPTLKPQLAKRLTADLVAALAAQEQSLLADHPAVSGKPTVVEAMTRVVVALGNNLPLRQVVACLTGAMPQSCQVHVLSSLLRDCAIEASGPLDLLSWTLCIGESPSAQEWMTQLGESLAIDCKSDDPLLRRWLSAMTSLAEQVQSHHPTASDLVLALLNGFDRGCNTGLDVNLDLNAEVNEGARDEAHVKCERLRAQLTREAERLVTEFDVAVRKASALANADIAQAAAPEQRHKRLLEDSEAMELCSGIVDRLADGVLTRKEVIAALEQASYGRETVAVLMHALVTQAKRKDGALYALFRGVLDEATRPDALMPLMGPVLLEGGGDIALAAALVDRLASEAGGAFTRLLPILGLIEALCLLVEGSRTLSPLNESVKGRVREAAAKQVVEAMQCVESATNALCEVRKLDRTARLTGAQLEELGSELLEGSIEALVQPLGNPVACAYVLEALHSFIHLPACGHLVSLLVRVLLRRPTVLDVFMGVLVNADVPPTASKAHGTLARQIALGFADWAVAGPVLVDHGPVLIGQVDGWIDAVKLDASAMGFEVLQVILDSLSSIKWRNSVKSRLVKRRNAVEKRMRARRAEPHVAPVIQLIASIREHKFGTRECTVVEDREKILEKTDINGAVNDIVLAVRRGALSMGDVIEWFSEQKATFDRELLLFTFIDPLFGESAASRHYSLDNFLDSLFDVDGKQDFFRDVGSIFGIREESGTDRKCMIDTIEALSIRYKDSNLWRLHWFATEYFEASAQKDDESLKLGKLLETIEAKLDGETALQAVAAERDIPSRPMAGMQPGTDSQSVIASSNSVPEVPLSLNSGAIDVRIKNQGLVPPQVEANPPPPLPQLPAGRIPPRHGPRERLNPAGWPGPAHREEIRSSPNLGLDGLPIQYSEAALPEDISHIIPVSNQKETSAFAKGVVEALNGGNFDAAKRMITRDGSRGLNLAGPDVPLLLPQGLETLGRIISDPSIVLRELALGNVTRGISKLTDGIGKSKHLQVLNLYAFKGHNFQVPPAVPEPPSLYNIENVLEQIKNLYPKSISLQQLVVSDAMIVDHESEPMLAKLEAASGGQLKVDRRD